MDEAFADSVLWQGKLLDGKPDMVAISKLVLNDLHGVADALLHRGQGNYRLDLTRSAILPAGVKSFERIVMWMCSLPLKPMRRVSKWLR